MASPNPVSLAASLLQSHSPSWSSTPSLQNSNCDAAPLDYSRGSPSLVLAVFFSTSRMGSGFCCPARSPSPVLPSRSLTAAGTRKPPVGVLARRARIAWRPLTLPARPLAVVGPLRGPTPCGRARTGTAAPPHERADSSSWSALPFPLPSEEHIGLLDSFLYVSTRLLLRLDTSANLPGRLTTGSSAAATILIAGPSPRAAVRSPRRC